jgi:hypothetical protein
VVLVPPVLGLRLRDLGQVRRGLRKGVNWGWRIGRGGQKGRVPKQIGSPAIGGALRGSCAAAKPARTKNVNLFILPDAIKE